MTPIEVFDDLANLLGRSTKLYTVTEKTENGRLVREHHVNPGAWTLDTGRFGYRIMQIRADGTLYPAITSRWLCCDDFVAMINVAFKAAEIMRDNVLTQMETGEFQFTSV